MIVLAVYLPDDRTGRTLMMAPKALLGPLWVSQASKGGNQTSLVSLQLPERFVARKALPISVNVWDDLKPRKRHPTYSFIAKTLNVIDITDPVMDASLRYFTIRVAVVRSLSVPLRTPKGSMQEA